MTQINWSPNTRTLRQFGPIALIGFGLLAALFVWKWSLPAVGCVFGGLGTATFVLSLVHLPSVRYVYVGLALITFPIGFVISHALMAALYYGVISPIGLLLRAAGHNAMARGFDREAATYWKTRTPRSNAASYFGQY